MKETAEAYLGETVTQANVTSVVTIEDVEALAREIA
jgi:hypothetical protein